MFKFLETSTLSAVPDCLCFVSPLCSLIAERQSDILLHCLKCPHSLLILYFNFAIKATLKDLTQIVLDVFHDSFFMSDIFFLILTMHRKKIFRIQASASDTDVIQAQ